MISWDAFDCMDMISHTKGVCLSVFLSMLMDIAAFCRHSKRIFASILSAAT